MVTEGAPSKLRLAPSPSWRALASLSLSSAVHARLSKVVRLADFGRVVQSKIAEAILRRASPKVVGGLLEVKDLEAVAAASKVSNGELENFRVCLRHHRDALRETANFLQYYNDRKVKAY